MIFVSIALIIAIAWVVGASVEPILDHIQKMKELELKKLDKDMEYLKLCDRLDSDRVSRLEREERLYRPEATNGRR